MLLFIKCIPNKQTEGRAPCRCTIPRVNVLVVRVKEHSFTELGLSALMLFVDSKFLWNWKLFPHSLFALVTSHFTYVPSGNGSVRLTCVLSRLSSASQRCHLELYRTRLTQRLPSVSTQEYKTTEFFVCITMLGSDRKAMFSFNRGSHRELCTQKQQDSEKAGQLKTRAGDRITNLVRVMWPQ